MACFHTVVGVETHVHLRMVGFAHTFPVVVDMKEKQHILLFPPLLVVQKEAVEDVREVAGVCLQNKTSESKS